MEQQSAIYDEINEAYPVLAGIDKRMPYALPENYFHQLVALVQKNIETDATLLAVNQEIYQVPDGYFDQFSSSVLSKIKAGEGENEVTAELHELAPYLLSLSKEPLFSLPEGYFEQTNFTSFTKTTTAPVFAIQRVRKFMQYAAAAVVTGILVFSAFMFTDNDTQYKSFEQYNQLDIPAALQTVSDESLETYLDNPEQISLSFTASATEIEDLALDLNTPIQNLSDDELTEYLDGPIESQGSTTIEKNK